MLLLLLVYLHVDVPVDFEGLDMFFTGSLHALSTTGLTEVDNDLRMVSGRAFTKLWSSIHFFADDGIFKIYF